MYTAACLSNDEKSKGGFQTVEQAETYVGQHLCKICKDELKAGEVVIEEENDIIKITSPMVTPCGAEWLIVQEEAWLTGDFEDVLKEAAHEN